MTTAPNIGQRPRVPDHLRSSGTEHAFRLITYRSKTPSQHFFDAFLTYLSEVLPSRRSGRSLSVSALSGGRCGRLTTCLFTPILADAPKLVGMTASRQTTSGSQQLALKRHTVDAGRASAY
jgi:hypothetical protein